MRILLQLAVLLGPPGLVALYVALRVRRSRRRQERIREWGRQKGYAILDMRNLGQIYEHLMPRFMRGPEQWRVMIQDEQGGQTTVSIFFGWRRNDMDVRWG